MAASTTAMPPSGLMHDSNHPNSSSKLQDQAATAALYATGNKHKTSSGQDFLDGNQRLSSSAAATSLKYADPQDLPSFPTTGLKKNNSAAGAAASLGWANQKPFEHWKPDPSASASKAAMLAKDYKMPPLWQPEQSSNGAKAALLAHKDGPKVEAWKPESTSWGNSAATQAFQKSRNGGSPPQVAHNNTAVGRQGSLLAATGAMAGSRRRAESTPTTMSKLETYPDESNATTNALRAATSAHRSRNSGSSELGGSSPYTNMSREMYTSHPPVAPEVDEQNRRDTLHASAVAMARAMYSQQQQQGSSSSAAQSGASAAHGREVSTASTKERGPQYPNLQEAANKLAQERLAKLQTQHSKNREYQDYYGVDSRPRSRLSIHGRTRRRANSDGSLDEDKVASAKIRAQMSLFSSTLSEVDSKKRQQDREALIAIAQRNVAKELHGMDEKVFSETGKAAPALLSEWELKAHKAAQANSKSRMENYGKVDIGGGKFVEQSEIDAVAKRNVQPVLDEINEKAEIERVRQAEAKLDEDRRQKELTDKKTREKEIKEINKKMKQQDKDEEKARKAEEKAARDEEKRLAKEKRKSTQSQKLAAISAPIAATSSKDHPIEDEPTKPASPTLPAKESTHPEPTADLNATPSPEPTTNTSPTLATRREIAPIPAPIHTSMEDQASLRMKENADAANPDEWTPLSPGSPGSKGKVKNWLKGKFSRKNGSKKESESKSGKEEGKPERVNGGDTSPLSRNPVEDPERERGRVGEAGAVRRDSSVSSLSDSPVEEDQGLKSGGKERTDEEDEEEFQEARDGFNEDLAPPVSFPAGKSRSPVREARFREEI